MNSIIIITSLAFIGIILILFLVSALSKQTIVIEEKATDIADVMPI